MTVSSQQRWYLNSPAKSPAFKVLCLPHDMPPAIGGAVEKVRREKAPIIAVVPAMLLIMAFFIMVQLQSFQKMLLVVSVAPLGVIGVVVALLGWGKPLGFVAILGVLALVGIIIRNSVILVTQIDEMLRDGLEPLWPAVAEATKHRMRPILLTALAAQPSLAWSRSHLRSFGVQWPMP